MPGKILTGKNVSQVFTCSKISTFTERFPTLYTMKHIAFLLFQFYALSLFAQIDEPPELLSQPEFPGGEAAMFNFIAKNILYPAEARNNNIQGTVVLTFVVNKDGKITDITIMKDIGGGCGAEAARVVAMMPDWKPGMTVLGPVKVRYTLPVKFRLEGGKSEKKKKKKMRDRDTLFGN